MEQFANRIAENSFHTPFNTERVADKIIDLVFKKESLLDLKNRVETLLDFPNPHKQPVEMFYLRNMQANMISEKLGVSIRSTWRYIEQGLIYLSNKLEKVDINTFTFNRLMNNHTWIKRLHASL